MKKKCRIKSKLRFTLFLTVILIMLISATGTALGLDFGRSAEPACTSVEIVAGDTLWDLAQEYGPQDKDVRKVVYEICKLNKVSADQIYPGQTILIPVEV